MRSCLAAVGWISLIGAILSPICPLASAQDLAIQSSHTGTFLLGQTNAYYLLRVRNVGAAPTTGFVSVAENAPAGLTITSMYGQGWDCTANSCGRSDPLAAGDSYTAIMVLATVAGSAPASLENQVTVSGGGDVNPANNIATDVTNIAAHGRPVGWGQDDCGKTLVPQPYTDIVALATGAYHSLALRSNGTVLAWGQDAMSNFATAVPAGLSGVVAIAAGDVFSLALKGDGTVVYWGDEPYLAPAPLYNIVAIATSAGGGAMALRSDGTVFAWGTLNTALTTVPPGLSGVVAISMGRYHALALKNDGTVVSWGTSSFVQPGVTASLANVIAIASGDFYNVALKRDGTIVAWGIDSQGETRVPVGLSNVIAVAAGSNYVLALKSDGTVVAWGYNGFGQTAIPAGLPSVIGIAAGWGNSLVLTDAVLATISASIHLAGPTGGWVPPHGLFSGPDGPLVVDGISYDGSGIVLQWPSGSAHTIGTDSPVAHDYYSRFAFRGWTDDGAIVHTVSPTSQSSYTATFNRQYLITTVANPPEGGNVSPPTDFFDEYSNIQITATPNPGYPFVGFTGGLTGAANPQSLSVTRAMTVTANFTVIAPPAAQLLVYPSNGATGVGADVMLQWSASVGADSYDVYVGKSTSLLLDGNTVETQYRSGTVISDGLTYYWKVVAKNSGGSTSSPIWSFTTQAAQTQTPPGEQPPANTTCVSAATLSAGKFASTGGTVTLSVQTTGSCAWSLPVLPAWIGGPTYLGYTGPQAIILTVAANTGAARSAQLIVDGITVNIAQAAPCLCTLGTAGQAHQAIGGSGAIQVVAAPDCMWALQDPPSWVTYTTASTGTGDASVSYQVKANKSARRSALVTVGGAQFAIDQNGATATSAGALPHFASGGSWLTQFTLLNTGFGTAGAQLNFFDNSGHPLVASAPASTSTLNPGAVMRIDAPISNGDDTTESTGWAQLLTDGTVNSYGVFKLKTEGGLQEAVVLPETRSEIRYYLPFDNTDQHFHGVALASQLNLASGVGVVIRDAETGKVTTNDVISLPSLGHTAFVMTDRYPETANMRGTLEFSSAFNGGMAVLGLRFNENHAFTSVPALVRSTVPAGTDLVVVGSMPHIAAGGGWKTVFMLTNPGTSAARAHLNFIDDNGRPLKLTLSLPQTPTFAAVQASEFEQTLAPGTLLEVVAVGGVSGPSDSSTQGWAQLQSDGGVTGVAAFQYQPLSGGQQEAVLPLESRNALAYILPLENTNGYFNAVAMSNLSQQKIAVVVTIRNAGSGDVLETGTISLPSQGHTAFLLRDRYGDSTSDADVTVEFATPMPGQLSVLGLRFNSNAAFTSVPAMAKQ